MLVPRQEVRMQQGLNLSFHTLQTMEDLVAPIPLESQRLALDGKVENSKENAKRPAPLTGGCRIEGYVRVKKVIFQQK